MHCGADSLCAFTRPRALSEQTHDHCSIHEIYARSPTRNIGVCRTTPWQRSWACGAPRARLLCVTLRFNTEVMLATVAVLVVLVQAIQMPGDWVVRRLAHRR